MAISRKTTQTSDDSLWYKDAIIYEVHVRAFFDENNDGIGDFRGLAERLDYLAELGITAIWLLPFYPSPLKDDGYDIADYRGVHPPYGTLSDVKNFIREAHARGIKVITELVVNHTSDQHPWFQKARRANSGSTARKFYLWSKKPDKYSDARIIFTDAESSNWAYDPLAKSYYWHRFYSHQPDLNYDHPPVHKAVFDVMDYWLGLGVDGLRLDAIPYLYKREGTSCENLPETHAFLKKLRRHVDRNFKDRMLLAEANQWPDDAALYFGKGDQCHMNFHFPLMPRLFMALHREDRFPISDILEETPTIPDSCQWAIFLRNHDELTLEMVTDEERDYMYQVYANDTRARINLGIRRRLAPLLGNDRRRIELMNSLLLSMPGTPVLYYGDEIGMGDNVYLGDRNGVRTPMQWSPDRNAGFSRANPQSLYLPVVTDPEFHYEAVNVETQLGNPRSLLWWMKRIIALRKRHQAFGRGDIRFLNPDNRKILAFVRTYESEIILVVANLSRFPQHVSLDLPDYAGLLPIELFSQGAFPPIDNAPYLLTLGPHSFFWFHLQTPTAPSVESTKPLITIPREFSWQTLFADSTREAFGRAIMKYVLEQRWFGGKAKSVRGAEIRELIETDNSAIQECLAFVDIHYVDGEPDTYLIPLGHAVGDQGAQIELAMPRAVIARIRKKGGDEQSTGILFDAAAGDSAFIKNILDSISRARKLKGIMGAVRASRSRQFGEIYGQFEPDAEVRFGSAEQSNSSAVIGSRMIVKLYRHLTAGENPEVELGKFLGNRGFHNIPRVLGHLDYQDRKGGLITLAIVHEFVKVESDAWELVVDRVQQYLTRVIATRNTQTQPSFPDSAMFENEEFLLPPEMDAALGADTMMARLLGKRTAQMHLKLASDTENVAFRPEPYTPFHRRALVQSVRKLLGQACQTLRKHGNELSGQAHDDAERLLGLEAKIGAWIRTVLDQKILAHRIRVHGDYHLGQLLHTGRDFMIIDFEGEPARSMRHRRSKRSALVDVAGMVRSFHYAALTGWNACVEKRLSSEAEVSDFESWIDAWHRWMSAAFVHSYYHTIKKQHLIAGKSPEELKMLLNLFLLEKAIYEVIYELNNRPRWVPIPLAGIRQVLIDLGLLQ